MKTRKSKNALTFGSFWNWLHQTHKIGQRSWFSHVQHFGQNGALLVGDSKKFKKVVKHEFLVKYFFDFMLKMTMVIRIL